MHGEYEPLTSVCGDRGSLLFAAGHAASAHGGLSCRGALCCCSGATAEGLERAWLPFSSPGLGHVQGFSSPQLSSCSSWAGVALCVGVHVALGLSGLCWFPRAALHPEQAWTYTVLCLQC